MIEVRYGNKPLELHPGKPTIEIGEQDNLLPVLSTIRQGIAAGELAKLLGTYQRPESVDALIALAAEDDPQLVLGAVDALKGSRDPRARAALRDLRSHPNAGVRAAADQLMATATDYAERLADLSERQERCEVLANDLGAVQDHVAANAGQGARS